MEALKVTCVGSRDGIYSLDLPVALMAGTLNSKINCIMHDRFLLNKKIQWERSLSKLYTRENF